MKSEIKSKEKKLTTQDLPEEYKILDIVIKGRKIITNIQATMELSNVNNKSEVLASMNKACSNFHYYSRVELELKELYIQEEEKFKMWMAFKKNEYSGKEYSSEASKERAVMVDNKEKYEAKIKNLAELKSYENQCAIAKKSLEKHIDMIKSIGAMIREEKSDPFPSSESDD